MDNSLKAEHQDYLNRSYKGKAELEYMEEPYRTIVERYGPWMCALTIDLPPITEAQEGFVRLFKEGGKATTEFELAWLYFKRATRYRRALAKEGVDYKAAREIMVQLAKKKFKLAIQWLDEEGPWTDTVRKKAHDPLGYRNVDWDNIDSLSVCLPGSAGSKG